MALPSWAQSSSPPTIWGSFTLSVTLPEDATEQQARDTLGQISDILMQNENVDTVGVLGSTGSSSMMSMVGGDATSIYVLLRDERSASTTEVAQQVRESTQDIPAEISINSQGADLSSMTGDAIAIEIYGQELDDLRQNRSICGRDAFSGGGCNRNRGWPWQKPELRITVDKTEAIKNGLTTGQVYAAVQAEIKQPSAASSLTQDGTTYDIYVNSGKTVDKQALESLKIENSEGKSIALKRNRFLYHRRRVRQHFPQRARALRHRICAARGAITSVKSARRYRLNWTRWICLAAAGHNWPGKMR